MSLEADGVWRGGLWASNVWADGVWREGEPQVVDIIAPNNAIIAFDAGSSLLEFSVDSATETFFAGSNTKILDK